MNSKQRRNKRVFVHEVILSRKESESLSAYESRVRNATGWLQWQTKSRNWTKGRSNWDNQTFYFRVGAVAGGFALKWL